MTVEVEEQRKLDRFSEKLSELEDSCNKSSAEVEKLFPCPDCGKKYKFENFLKVHKRRLCKF
jgi:hypothetical protein